LEMLDKMAADKAGAAGNEDGHHSGIF
jgi:hypothetical protein